MKTLSEIDTTSKRAARGAGFSWGIAEEVGKNIKLMEMFGMPGLKNLNEFFKIYKNKQFQTISLINKLNESSKISYCPISLGINFLDQINLIRPTQGSFFVGNGCQLVDEYLRKLDSKVYERYPNAEDLLREAEIRLRVGNTLDPKDLAPVYLTGEEHWAKN